MTIYQTSSDAAIDFDVRSATILAERLAESGVTPELNIQSANAVSLRATAAEYAAVAAWLNALGYTCAYTPLSDDPAEDDRSAVDDSIADLYAVCGDTAAMQIEEETRDVRGSYAYWQGRDGWYYTHLAEDGMSADHWYDDHGPYADRAAVIDAIDDQNDLDLDIEDEDEDA